MSDQVKSQNKKVKNLHPREKAKVERAYKKYSMKNFLVVYLYNGLERRKTMQGKNAITVERRLMKLFPDATFVDVRELQPLPSELL